MTKSEPANFDEIAIIGLSGRFPGARSVEQFWHNLSEGIEGISFFSDEELEASGISRELLQHPNYIRAKGVLDDIEMFDASFFGFTPREAEVMDPQHRLFLECAWEALEQAGYQFEESNEPVGVYGGSGMSTYLLVNLLSNPELIQAVNPLQFRMMNDKDFLTTHVSYRLNLKGPSVSVQTACSTSLVAVHLACQSLLDGECNLALAGGVAATFPHKAGYLFQEGGILSPDGHCRAFDARAQGTVEGSGAGVVVLKRLSEAVDDGDCIHAVIKGSAVNNDGSLKVGFTAPSVETQTRVVVEAMSMAGVSPETITYVEAHGSGTLLGDPVEVAALTMAFRTSTEKKSFCALGSVKTNVGHCDNAAGMASLIKTVAALQHKLIPPTLHFQTPAAQINLSDSPFYINARPTEWKSTEYPRRAGVSSLGIGGTNAHLILEEAPEREKESRKARDWQLLVLSAKSEAALNQTAINLADHLKQQQGIDLDDVAYTLQVGRRRFNHCRALVCRNADEAVTALESNDPRWILSEFQELRDRQITFMFPGLGDHHVGMARGLYRNEPTFRAHVDRCSELLEPQLGVDLREVLYPGGRTEDEQVGALESGSPSPSFSSERRLDFRKLLHSERAFQDEGSQRLNQTRLTQPAVFVIEYALAQLLIEWGIRPHSMIGYSIGEYTAACLAGVFSLEDALYLVATRAQMIDNLPRGEMLAIPLSADEVRPLLGDGLSVSATNGPSMTVVAGTAEAMRVLERRLDERGVASRQLQTSHAFHSQMMEPILAAFADRVREVSLKAPEARFVSNLTGTWITDDQATDSEYWSRHMRNPVRFAEGLAELLLEPDGILLEVGPGQGLSTLARQHPLRNVKQPVLASMRDRRDEVSDEPFLLGALGQLWLAGARIDWSGYSAHRRRRRVPLPTYPFERRRFWVEPGRHTAKDLPEDSPARKSDLADWFYIPVWKQSPLLGTAGKELQEEGNWLIFSDEIGLGRTLAAKLREKMHSVVCVAIGDRFENGAEDLYTINPSRRDDYEALLIALSEHGRLPEKLVHMWGVTAEVPACNPDTYQRCQERGFYSLLLLAQALGERGVTAPIQICVVTSQTHVVIGEETTCPLKATVWGACKVIPQEYPNISCVSIDVAPTAPDSLAGNKLADQLLGEMLHPVSNQAVAYRCGRRWVREFEKVRLESRMNARPGLLRGKTYLITGGTDETGLRLAEHLSQQFETKLILIASPSFPPAGKWERWLSAHDGEDETSRKIRRIRAIEASGHEVLTLSADVSDEEQMRDAIAKAGLRFGEIHGVIHAATAAEAGIIQLKTSESASTTPNLKVRGALVLASVTKSLPLDFFALFSSTLSLAGGVGQVDACASNAFLDAFSHYNSEDAGWPVVSINWSAFQWDSWQLPSGTGFSELSTHLQQGLATFGIRADEATAAFDRILSQPLSQVIVSPRDLRRMLEETDAMTAASLMQAVEQARPSEAHSRPELDVAYEAPVSEAQRAIAGVWQQAFGLEKVGIHDNFFDLSGNSLLAIQIVTRLRDIFKVQLPLTSLFELPTIDELSQRIEDLRIPGPAVSEMSRMLSEIEALTVDEAEKEFTKELKMNG